MLSLSFGKSCRTVDKIVLLTGSVDDRSDNSRPHTIRQTPATDSANITSSRDLVANGRVKSHDHAGAQSMQLWTEKSVKCCSTDTPLQDVSHWGHVNWAEVMIYLWPPNMSLNTDWPLVDDRSSGRTQCCENPIYRRSYGIHASHTNSNNNISYHCLLRISISY